MIARKPSGRILIGGAVLPAIVITCAGCSGLFAKKHDQPNWWSKHHHLVESVATVDVGGQVHEPTRLELTADGLTLRRALMAAGGARELAVAEARTTSDPDRIAKLQRITALNREAGVLAVHREVYNKLGNEAIGLFDRTPEQVRDAITVNAENVKALTAELAKSLDAEALTALEGHSRRVGINGEKLALSSNPQLRGVLEYTGEQFEQAQRQASEYETQRMNGLISSIGLGVGLRSVRTEFLVALERSSSLPPVTYYFPYDLAIAGPASEIRLTDGDAVSVVEIRDSELNAPSAGTLGGSKNVAIDGYVNSPGMKSLTTIGEVPFEGKPNISDAYGVWMLVRPSLSGKSQQVFVLPDRLVAANGAAADAPTAEGDVYNYLILPQVPIVTEALLVQTLEISRRHCTDKIAALKQKKQQHKGKLHRHVERLQRH